MPQYTEKQKAEHARDELNVSRIIPGAVTEEMLVEDIERLASLVIRLAGEIDYLKSLSAGVAR